MYFAGRLLRIRIGADFVQRLEEVKLFDGTGLGAHLKGSLIREWERLELVQEQLRALESEIASLIEHEQGLVEVRSLMSLCGVGKVGAWTLVLEIFGWRAIANRRELAALVGVVLQIVSPPIP